MVQTALPIDAHVDEIVGHVRRERFAVVVAPPGSGKTTRLPPALSVLGPTILLQPRRVAARALARRIAAERGWTIGNEIGWQIRFERRFSRTTRLLVATEGILTARLQSDPLLSDFRVVILDEFHERSIHADLAIALVKEAAASRDDLAVVVMSATIDAAAVAGYLNGRRASRSPDGTPGGLAGETPAVHQTAAGHKPVRVFDIAAKRYPIEIAYRPGSSMAASIREALKTAKGDILAFLPGVREIDRTRGELAGIDALVLPLHGTLDVDEQERAIAPASRRKVILSTNIAETSLTVEGVTDIIDSGVHKILRFDAETAVDHLVTERIAKDSADQRAGRAGRTGPGRATRLWDERDILRPHREPEVNRVDLAAPLLDLIAWGGDPETFDWFERPPQPRIDAALELLAMLGAIDGAWASRPPVRRGSSPAVDLDDRNTPPAGTAGGLAGETPAVHSRPRLTALGDQIRRFPLHPRLARLIIEGGGAGTAVAIAAALSEGVRLTRSETTRSDAFAIADLAPRNVVNELSSIAQRILGEQHRKTADETTLLRAILAAYPDRVAQRREPKSERLLLASGTGAVLARESGVRDGEFLVALDIAGSGSGEALVRMASFVERDWLTPTQRENVHRLENGRVRAVEQSWYGEILLHEQSVAPDRDESRRLLAGAMRSQVDPQFANRIAFAKLEIDWDALFEHAAAAHKRPGAPDLDTLLPFDVRKKLDRLAPQSCPLPSGRSAKLDYREDGSVFAAVKLQELFGLAETPKVGPEQTPITFELLSPAGRPVQVTRDLRNFWNSTYAEVRKELRARYPKHPWPEDPWTAKATHRTKRRS